MFELFLNDVYSGSYATEAEAFQAAMTRTKGFPSLRYLIKNRFGDVIAQGRGQ